MEPVKRPLVRRTTLLLAASAVALLLIAMSMVHVIPPRALTITAMGETSVRIRLHWHREKSLPADLSALPLRGGYANRTTDAWKRPLLYSIESSDTFTLRSLGRDGKPGGSEDDADIAHTYRIERGEVRELEK
jgi:hypothetical protein